MNQALKKSQLKLNRRGLTELMLACAFLSLLPVSTVLPSGLKAMARTQPLCCKGGPAGLPVAVSHSCAVLS